MPISIAMPVAHITGAATYADWYGANNQCIFEVANYFNRGGAKGISLRASAAGAAAASAALWNLYAFTDGFLSYRDQALVLRLPRELNRAAWRARNSGKLFFELTPRGAQLAHVVYAFSVAPAQAAVHNKICDILSDANHPSRNLTRVALPAGGTQTLQEYIAASAANVDAFAQLFLEGAAELFVRAGDVIGNFQGVTMEIRFHDSCGSVTRTEPAPAPVVPKGRPLNPSYFLYLVRSQANTTPDPVTHQPRVTLLTRFGIMPQHPLETLFAAANIPAAGNADQALNVGAAHPPKPLHATIAVQNAADANIADRGISIGALGEWHESRNAPGFGGIAVARAAPVEWRLKGNQADDNAAADYCKFVTRAKDGMGNRLPDIDVPLPGIQFDHFHAPLETHTNRVQSYWQRHDRIFNAVATAFEVPCELLLTLACHESGGWFAQEHETDVIAIENFPERPGGGGARYTAAEIAAFGDAADLPLLTNYAGLVARRNYNIPIPWNGNAAIFPPNGLTWAQLASLIQNYHNVHIGNNNRMAFIKVSPGMIQTLVSSASGQLTWAEGIYGNDVVQGISFTDATTNVVITADAPPDDLDDLFSDWFGVSVNAAGVNTNNAAAVNLRLSRKKRALHNLIAGACHVKRTYNHVVGGAGNRRNFISDFDLPTVASAYNDGAVSVDAAEVAATAETKWKRLFALTFYDAEYAKNAPKYFNAAVDYFNANFGAANPQFARPALRLWRP